MAGTATSSPYTIRGTNVPAGSYAITAVATDSAGATATSGAVTVVVGTPPPSTVLGVSVSPSPVSVGHAATVTVTGTNPCGMLWMDYGDGDWWIAPITGGLPQVFAKTWTTPGTYTVMAKGFSDCTGQVTTTVTVTGEAPAPDPADDGVAPIEVPPAATAVTLEDDEPSTLPSISSTIEPEAPLTTVTIYVDLNGSGSGSVTGSASCTGTTGTGCAASVVDGASLTLTAAATAGSVFTGWSGLCTGTSPTCTLTAFDHALAVANFRAAPAPVLQYYHVDTLGSVRAVTDASGAVLERHDYRPFGEDNQALPAPGANAARFLGQQRDQTKLDDFGARYFDMHTGRFTGVDPILSPAALTRPQKFNRYVYAENNPLRYADTSGLDDWDDQMAANMDYVNQTIAGMGDSDGNQVIPIGPCSEVCQDFSNWSDGLYVDWSVQALIAAPPQDGVAKGLITIMGLDAANDVLDMAKLNYDAGNGSVTEYENLDSTVVNRADDTDAHKKSSWLPGDPSLSDLIHQPGQYYEVGKAGWNMMDTWLNTGLVTDSKMPNVDLTYMANALGAAASIATGAVKPLNNGVSYAWRSLADGGTPTAADLRVLGKDLDKENPLIIASPPNSGMGGLYIYRWK